MFTLKGIQFNMEMIFTMVILFSLSFMFTRKWTDGRKVRLFYTLMGLGYVVLIEVIMPLIFVLSKVI